jgi:hypothetical protein
MKTLLRFTINTADDARKAAAVCQSIADQLCGHAAVPTGELTKGDFEATKRDLEALALWQAGVLLDQPPTWPDH